MLITEEFLQRHNACRDGLYRFTKNFPTGGHIDDVLRAVICSNGAEAHWVSWLMIRARYRSTDWLNNNPSVGWSLDLRGTGVTSLPDNLSVGGRIYQ